MDGDPPHIHTKVDLALKKACTTGQAEVVKVLLEVPSINVDFEDGVGTGAR